MIKYSGKAIERAISCLADIALESAKEHCPVRTGRLKNSITCVREKDKAVIFTNVDYAAAVELGTSRQRPQPYLSSGIDKAARMAGIVVREEIFGND